MNKKKILSLAALVLVSSGAWAHDDHVPHYLVYEVPTPDLADPQCVPGYATSAWLGGVNNRHFAAGTSSCYHDFGLTPAGLPNIGTVYKPFAWSPQTGSYLLPSNGGGGVLTVDEYGNGYGYQTGAGLDGAKWVPGAGAPQSLYATDPLCGWNISIAITANARGEIGGWAVRAVDGDPNSCNTRAVIREPSGVEVLGPLGSSPSAVTNAGIVGLSVNNHAAKWNFHTDQIVMLRPDTDPEISYVTGMIERGVAVGISYVYVSQPPTGPLCTKSKALVWDARNRERTLPNLAGTITSWPNAINEDEVVVGYSSDNFCPLAGNQNAHAAIWINDRATDLNRQIVGRPGVVLNSAIGINDRGEIVATGYRAADAQKPCPQVVFSPEDGTSHSDDSTCRDSHAYLLIPVD